MGDFFNLKKVFVYIDIKCPFIYLLISMTMVVMMAARKTKPPNTPRAMIPPVKINIYIYIYIASRID